LAVLTSKIEAISEILNSLSKIHVTGENVSVSSVEDFSLEVGSQGSLSHLVILKSDISIG